jgi:hypothetical protein
MKYKITDESVLVVIETYRTHETAREIRYIAKGWRIMTWTRRASDDIDFDPTCSLLDWTYDEMTSWEEDFTPFTEVKFGKSESLAEYTARRDWEGMQYRCGTRSDPMDSASRAAEGYSPMEDYWTAKG